MIIHSFINYSLIGGKIGINDEDDSTFTITCDHRTFHFQARDGDERTRWVQVIAVPLMLVCWSHSSRYSFIGRDQSFLDIGKLAKFFHFHAVLV